MATYQTISEFLHSPFGSATNPAKLIKYDTAYRANRNKIILNAHTKIDDAFYFHVKVPSESQKDGNVYYDVVIRFFTDKAESLASSHIRDYYIQFFSNSPGFIYHYAVLYKNKGFLIDSLYTKLDPRYFDKLPVKTNAKMELSYDKSIYFACNFLNEKKFKVLNKFGILFGKKLLPQAFFKEIKDFQSIKYENELLNIERKSLKNLAKTLETEKSKEANSNPKTNDIHRKNATTSTLKEPINHTITKKTATNTTSSVKTIIRKTAGKSTIKK
jgi:hypothetical protein